MTLEEIRLHANLILTRVENSGDVSYQIDELRDLATWLENAADDLEEENESEEEDDDDEDDDWDDDEDSDNQPPV